MYQNFSKGRLSTEKKNLQEDKRYLQANELKQLDILQAEKTKELEFEKQETMSMSRDSSSGKVYMII